MDLKNDLNSIEETLQRGKSIVQESIDLTRKNAERRKEVEKKLQTCFSGPRLCENSFTLDLENNQFSIITKEKNVESDIYIEENLKSLYGKIDDLEKEKRFTQERLEEYQDIVRDLESENFSYKSKIRGLVAQLKETEEELKRVNEDAACLRDENEQFRMENLEIKAKYEKIIKENGICKDSYKRLLGEFEMLNDIGLAGRQEKGSFSALSKKFLKNRNEFDSESSTESYHQLFSSLKKHGTEKSVQEKSSFTPLVDLKEDSQKSFQKTEYLAKFKLRNEEIVDRLEENYKKTDEKLKKISKNIIHHTNPKKKCNSSFADLRPLLSETSKPKISVKIKHKRAQNKKKLKKKIS